MENQIDIQMKAEPLGVKTYSKWAMVFSSLWIAVLTILKGLKILNLELKDILYSGVAITAIWCPTYFSIWLDKIKEIKFGDNKE